MSSLTAQHQGRIALKDVVDFFADPSKTAAPVPTTVPPPAQTTVPGTTADPGDNPCGTMTSISNTLAPLQDITVAYTIDCAKEEISFTVSGESAGWLAVGLNDGSTGMPGTDTYQVTVDGQGKAVVRNGNANGGKFVADDPDDIFVGEPTGQRDGLVLSVTFTRKLVATNAGDRTIAFGSPLNIIVAKNVNADADIAAQHSQNGVGSAPIELFATDVVVVEEAVERPLILVHGALMIAAWAVLAPIGAFFPRFLKMIGHSWYLTHRAMLSMVTGLTVLAWVLAIVHIETLIFTSPHVIIGLVIVILALAQPIIGILANRWFDPERSGVPIFPDIVHQWLGRVLTFLGFVNCLLGLVLYVSGVDGPIQFPPSAIVFVIWSLIALGYTVAGQFVLGTGHDGDKDKGIVRNEPTLVVLICFLLSSCGVTFRLACLLLA